VYGQPEQHFLFLRCATDPTDGPLGLEELWKRSFTIFMDNDETELAWLGTLLDRPRVVLDETRGSNAQGSGTLEETKSTEKNEKRIDF
jgi:hypothetical protein